MAKGALQTTESRRGRRLQDANLVAICALLGALLGAVAGIVAGSGEPWDVLTPLLELPYSSWHQTTASFGAITGAAGGLFLSPLLRLSDRDKRMRRVLLTSLLCLPVAALSGLMERGGLSFCVVALAVGGLFIALSRTDGPWWGSHRGRRILVCVSPLVITVGLTVLLIQRRWPSTVDVPTLLKIMQTNDSLVQERAAARLEAVGGTTALLSALEHPHPNVRFLAARSLQYHPSGEVRHALAKAVEDPVPWVARMAAFSLDRIGGLGRSGH